MVEEYERPEWLFNKLAYIAPPLVRRAPFRLGFQLRPGPYIASGSQH